MKALYIELARPNGEDVFQANNDIPGGIGDIDHMSTVSYTDRIEYSGGISRDRDL